MASATGKQNRPAWSAQRSGYFGRSVVLALAVHALLLAGLVTAFQWKTQSETVYAELWSSVPLSGTDLAGVAQKPEPAPEPEPEPEPPKAPEKVVEPKPEPKPEPAPAPKVDEAKVKADIVAEQEKKAKQEALAKEKQLQEEKQRKAREEAEKKKQEEAEKKAQAAKLKAMEQLRSQELARVRGGAPSSTRAGTPTGDRTAQYQNLSGSLKASFMARVAACIRPHIIFDVPAGTKRGQYRAVYQVRLLPSGDQVGSPKKIKASGLPGYDAAVERAIAKCPRFPSSSGVVMPAEVSLTFDPIDSPR